MNLGGISSVGVNFSAVFNGDTKRYRTLIIYKHFAKTSF